MSSQPPSGGPPVDQPAPATEDRIATDETVDLLVEVQSSPPQAPLLLPPPLFGEATAQDTEPAARPATDPADSLEAPGAFTQAMSPIMPLIGERYRPVAMVGRGSTGRVYRAYDTQLEEVVALKVMREDLVDLPEIVERFRREVKLARRVTHPHVARTYDIGEHAGQPFMTMEFVDGPTLRDVIRSRAPLALAEAARIGHMLCAGLDAAHQAGIVHRDLKPDNVMLRSSGDVVITDFGIAHALTGRDTNSGRLFVGTPAYMAPEQVDGAKAVDARADLYAVGLIMYEMLTGQRVWTGASPVDVATARLHTDPPDPGATLPEVPYVVADLLRRCMAVDRDVRPASAREVLDILATLTEPDRPDSSRETGVPQGSVAGHLETVAVLPFDDRSASDTHLAQGLTEDIIDVLSMTPGLRVRPLALVLSRTATIDPRALGRELDVAALVTGRILRRGDQLRVRARVTSVEDGFQLWAGRFECRVQDVFGVADQVAVAVAEALMVSPRPESTRIEPPDDGRAVDLLLEGRLQLRRFWHEDVRGAIRALDEALALAPGDPRILAAAAVARARMAFLGTGVSDGRLLHEAEGLARQARSSAPDRPEPYFAHAMVLFNLGRPTAAAERLEMALIRSPGDFDIQDLLGRILLEVGPIEQAGHHLDLALKLDPEAYNTRWDLARARAFEGRWAEVDRLLAAAVDERQAAWVRCGIRARLDVWRGDPRWTTAPLPEGSGGIMEPVIRLLRSASIDGVTDALHDQLLAQAALAARSAPRRATLMHQFAAEFAGRAGNRARCLESIEAAVALGLTDLMWLDHCPVLRAVADDDCFVGLRTRVMLRLRRA